jgi:hypothetical protein
MAESVSNLGITLFGLAFGGKNSSTVSDPRSRFSRSDYSSIVSCYEWYSTSTYVNFAPTHDGAPILESKRDVDPSQHSYPFRFRVLK